MIPAIATGAASLFISGDSGNYPYRVRVKLLTSKAQVIHNRTNVRLLAGKRTSVRPALKTPFWEKGVTKNFFLFFKNLSWNFF